jgi:hypothetical protein
VINSHDNDGKRAEKIEARLALTICEARIDSESAWRCRFSRLPVNGSSKK